MATELSEKQLEEHLKRVLSTQQLINREFKEQDQEVIDLANHLKTIPALALKQLKVVQRNVEQAQKLNDIYGDTVSRLTNCHKQMKRYGEAVKTAGVHVNALGDSEEETTRSTMKRLSATLDGIAKQNEGYQSAQDELRRINDEIAKMTQQYSRYGRKREEIDGKILDAQMKILDMKSKGKDPTQDELTANDALVRSLQRQKDVLAEIDKEVQDAAAGFAGYGKNAEGLAHLKVAKNAMGGLTNIGDPAAMAQTAEKLAGLGELMGDGFLKTIVSGAAGFAKALSGPLGMVIFGAIEAGKRLIELDNKRKGWVKDYSTMAGQQFSGGNFVKQASDFNATIFDVKRNMDLGTDFKEWQDMFKAFHSAGITVDALSDKTGDLGKIEEDVFTTSKELGMDLNQTAQLMGDSMLETRSSLDKVRDSYNFIADAAKKSGLESSRFMQVVNQSVLALGTYGNFLKVAAKNLRNFSESGVTSQKDAEAASASMTDLLSKGGIENIPILEMAKQGGLDITGAMGSQLSGKQGRMEELKKGGLLTKEDKDEFAKLAADVATLGRAVANPGDPIAMGQAAPFLTEMSGDIVNAIVKASGAPSGDWSVLKTLPGMNEKLLETIGRNTDSNMAFLKSMTSDQSKGGVQDILSKNMDALVAGSNATEEQVSKLNESITSSNLGAEVKEGLSRIIDKPKYALKLLDMLKTGNGNMKELALGAAADSDSNDVLGRRTLKDQGKMVKELTQTEKYMGILKDGAELMMADNALTRMAGEAAVKTAKTVGSIEGMLFEHFASSSNSVMKAKGVIANKDLEAQTSLTRAGDLGNLDNFLSGKGLGKGSKKEDIIAALKEASSQGIGGTYASDTHEQGNVANLFATGGFKEYQRNLIESAIKAKTEADSSAHSALAGAKGDAERAAAERLVNQTTSDLEQLLTDTKQARDSWYSTDAPLGGGTVSVGKGGALVGPGGSSLWNPSMVPAQGAPTAGGAAPASVSITNNIQGSNPVENAREINRAINYTFFQQSTGN